MNFAVLNIPSREKYNEKTEERTGKKFVNRYREPVMQNDFLKSEGYGRLFIHVHPEDNETIRK